MVKGAYPSLLKHKIREACPGKQVFVKNFGVASKTVFPTHGDGYANTTAFASAVDYPAQYAVIMLGTTDAEKKNWRGARTFRRHYVDLVQSFARQHRKVLLVTPPPVFDTTSAVRESGRFNKDLIRYEIRDIIRECSQSLRLPLLDLVNVFDAVDGIHDAREDLDSADPQVSQRADRLIDEYFTNGWFPTPLGNEVIAQAVYDQIATLAVG